MNPFVDLKAQYETIRKEIALTINRLLETTQIVLGEEVANFGREFAEYCGARFAVGLNSGISALHLALLVAGAKPGDEVITVSHTFVENTAVHHIFPVFSPQLDELAEHLKAAGVATGIHYPVPVHLQPAFAHVRERALNLPSTELASRETLSLPMYPELCRRDLQHITEAGAVCSFGDRLSSAASCSVTE